ncbi:MAG: queuosine precursor transporter [Rickettsiaceae bacterium]
MSGSIKLYVTLCSTFCTVIVTGNLIFQKFVSINIFTQTFEISVGVLLYPITFLISDLVTEFYGKERAELMVRSGVICSIIVLFLIIVADTLPVTSWSKVDNETFSLVFGVYGVGTIASIIANYFGQLVDIHVFSYFKELTNNKHLWIRNNISTILGQFVDTIIVVLILSLFKVIGFEHLVTVIYSSFAFKVVAALLDTPFCYLGHYLIRKYKLDSPLS